MACMLSKDCLPYDGFADAFVKLEIAIAEADTIDVVLRREDETLRFLS